jgi:hypothetical protein
MKEPCAKVWWKIAIALLAVLYVCFPLDNAKGLQANRYMD